MKETRIRYRGISLLLVFVFIIASLPLSVTALGADETSLPNTQDGYTQEYGYTITEDESRREENVKHFKLEDGSYQAIVYGDAVHKKDADGKWQDIDNTLALQNVKNTSRYTTTDSRVSFADAFSPSRQMMTINENGYSVSLSLITNEKTNSSTTKVVNHASRSEQLKQNAATTSFKKLTTIDNKTTIKYENIIKNIDLEYILISNKVKENIIVKEICDNYRYVFTLEVEGLVAKLNENGIIGLCDAKSGEAKYAIPAPFMYDANGEKSYDISYALKDIGNGKYELTVTADEKWINTSERAFPVVIDPSVTSGSVALDTFVNVAAPNDNYGTWDVWVAGSHTGFIKCNMPTLPSGAIITSATLSSAYYYMSGVTGRRIIGAYQMTGAWDEYTITYNTLYSAYGSSLGISSTLLSIAGATAAPDITFTNPKPITFDVTSIVQLWYNGTTNNGIALKHYSGSPTAPGGTNTGTIIISWDAQTAYTSYYTISYIASLDGTYYLKNGYASKYMQIDDGDAPAYSTNQARMELWGFSGDAHQKWVFTNLANGYYKITSAKSGKALSVQAAYVDEDEEALVQETYSGAYRQQWRIVRNSAGRYILYPRSGEAYPTNWAMSAGINFFGITDGLNVEQRPYTNNSEYKDEWLLEKVASSSVEREIQQWLTWCWVTSARMFSKHYRSSVTKTQSEAVAYIKNNIPDRYFEGGTNTEIVNAIKYFTDGLPTLNPVSCIHEVYDEKTLIEIIDANHVIAVGRQKYSDLTDPTSSSTAHEILIYGYINYTYTVGNTVVNDLRFLIRDPWGTSSDYMMSYEKLFNGRSPRANETPDEYIWIDCVILNDIYSLIPYYFG